MRNFCFLLPTAAVVTCLICYISLAPSYQKHSVGDGTDIESLTQNHIDRNSVVLHRKLAINHKKKVNETQDEFLGELYYQHQMIERDNSRQSDFYTQYGANYPCIYGVSPIGSEDSESINDGHKFACGLQKIKSKPIIYSFGSNKQQDFEKSILSHRPDALVFTFEIKAMNLPPVGDRDKRITYTVMGLGPPNLIKGMDTMLLHKLMKMHNHTHIDILKVDIEGSEYSWVKNEPLDTFTRVGQLLIEVHNNREDGVTKLSHDDMRPFMESLEKRDLRIFHKEMNLMGSRCCCEFSYIKKNWNAWNHIGKFELPSL